MTGLWVVLLLMGGVVGGGETQTGHRREVHVAVASNFAYTLQDIAAVFEAETGSEVVISAGSTGRHFAQISAGAPFDIFLAADTERPRLLEENGLAVSGSRFTYAEGKLVIYGDFKGPDGLDILRAPELRFLAMANPRLAPYGRAAQQVLERLDLWDGIQAKLVRGQNVGQAWQFVASGNAELGLVSWAQVWADQRSGHQPRTVVEIPANLYDPIEQQAVLLTRAVDHEAAGDFLAFLRGPEARAIIKDYGYAQPDKDGQ